MMFESLCNKKYKGVIMKFKNIFQDKIDLVEKLYKSLCTAYDVEDLHKYRVNLRKMFAYTQVFGTQIDKENAKEASKLFKEIIKPTSLLRDLDLFLIEIDFIACCEQSKTRLHQMFTFKRDALLVKFQDDTYKKNLHALKLLTKKNKLFETDFQKLDKVAILQNMSEKLSKQFSLIDQDSSFEQLHKLRIKFKRFRYALEMYLHHFNDENQEIKNLYDLKELQDLFGIIQDNNTRLELLAEVSDELINDEYVLLKSDLNQKIQDAKQKLFCLVG